MSSLKRKFKSLFVKTHTLFILDGIAYVRAYFRGYRQNKKFRHENPEFVLPPDYYLYETSKLDYRQYREEGELAAIEILGWIKKYVRQPLRILEWGCGVARIVRHMPRHAGTGTTVYGADINRQMIEWDAAHIKDVQFSLISYQAPTHFSDLQFNFIYAFSVFTHIEGDQQEAWLREMNRILDRNGVFLFTSHGKKYEANMDADMKAQFHEKGYYTISYHRKGHRMMTTYNRPNTFRTMIEKYFVVCDYFDGMQYPEMAGGQDVWIVQRP